MKLSLVKKLSILIIFAIAILTIITAYSIHNITQNEIESMEKRSLLNINKEQASRLEGYFDNAKTNIKVILSHDELVEYISKDEKILQEENILKIFEHHNLQNDFLSIYLMDIDGDVLVATDETFVAKNYGFREYFQQAIEGKEYIDVVRGITSEELGYYFSAPVIDENKLVVAVLVGKLNPKVIHDVIKSYPSNQHLGIMLADEYGVVIYASSPEKIYKSLGSLSDEELKFIKDKRRFDGITLGTLDYNEIQEYIRTDNKFAVFDIYDSYDQEHEVVSIVSLERFPFNLILEEEANIITEISTRISQTIVLIFGFFALLMALLIYFLINKFLEPLKVLEVGMENIEAGDLSYRTSINTRDELQDIGDGFNKMAAKLEKNIASIEKKVHERTETLEKLNKHMIGRELKMVELKRKIDTTETDNK